MTDADIERLRLALVAATRQGWADVLAERITNALGRGQAQAEARRRYEESGFATRMRESREALQANVAQFACTQRATSAAEHLACDTRPRSAAGSSCCGGCR